MTDPQPPEPAPGSQPNDDPPADPVPGSGPGAGPGSVIGDVTDSIKRIGGYLSEVVPILDEAGKVVDYTVRPLMIEFKVRDIAQIIVGASLLALPLCFTEEAWNLGRDLPMGNVLALGGLSIAFITMFVFFNFYRGHFRGHVLSFVSRVVVTYAVSLAVVSVVLALLNKTPWQTDAALAFKRVIIITFPASMAGSVTDALK